MCFNVMYGNKDDHGTSFAVLYDAENEGYKLSPFCDRTQTKDKFEHEMTLNGVGNPNEKDLLEVAKERNFQCKNVEKLLRKLKNCFLIYKILFLSLNFLKTCFLQTVVTSVYIWVIAPEA